MDPEGSYRRLQCAACRSSFWGSIAAGSIPACRPCIAAGRSAHAAPDAAAAPATPVELVACVAPAAVAVAPPPAHRLRPRGGRAPHSADGRRAAPMPPMTAQGTAPRSRTLTPAPSAASSLDRDPALLADSNTTPMLPEGAYHRRQCGSCGSGFWCSIAAGMSHVCRSCTAAGRNAPAVASPHAAPGRHAVPMPAMPARGSTRRTLAFAAAPSTASVLDRVHAFLEGVQSRDLSDEEAALVSTVFDAVLDAAETGADVPEHIVAIMDAAVLRQPQRQAPVPVWAAPPAAAPGANTGNNGGWRRTARGWRRGNPRLDATDVDRLPLADGALCGEGQCAICLVDFQEDADDLRSLPCCGHVFHGRCIRPWLVERHAVCPLDMQEVVL